MARKSKRLAMPLVNSIELQSFTLYRLRERIKVPLSHSVVCIVGANGLGKSTFLAALTYGLTGAVPPPNPRFNSIGAYHSLAAAYAVRFFDGRVDEHDRDAAEVVVEFRLADNDYRLVRSVFSPGELRSLSVISPKGGQLVRKSDRQSGESLNRRYEQLVTTHTGLASFAQFVFLNHFMLSFDERRHLLFFDPGVAEKIIYLSFGLDPAVAERADELRRQVDAADSLMRNFQYDATVARKQLERFRMLAAGEAELPPSAALLAEYEQLRDQRATAEENLAALLDELNGSRLALAESAGRLHQAETTYSDVFTDRLRGHSPAADHPIVRSIIEDMVCGVCGTTGSEVSNTVREALDTAQCPLCGSALASGDMPHTPAAALQKADEALTMARDLHHAAQARVDRLSGEVADARAALGNLEDDLAELERGSPELAAARDAADSATVDTVEGRLRAAIHTAEQHKEVERTQRDDSLAELRPLQQQLMATFAAAETEFVPRFRSLAEEFIGLPLDISLASAGKAQVQLILTVQGQRRNTPAQLSESQRYFLDVALRMALAEQLGDNAAAALYIDTPEGALDIAYEARVGSMFARFVETGNRIVMTANVNSSQLLLRLADECGPDGMAIERMTDWTTLTDVQVAEEALFDKALHDLEQRLAGRRGPAKEMTRTTRRR